MQSMCISSQWLSYFADQINLTKQIKPSILSETTIRLYRHDYGWSQLERWKELMPNLTYDSGESKIEKHYCDTKLCLATCNATTYLETFRLNIPTVLFWDPYYWENRESALPIFNELKRVKVFLLKDPTRERREKGTLNFEEMKALLGSGHVWGI